MVGGGRGKIRRIEVTKDQTVGRGAAKRGDGFI
jgi:hypothetical protein